MPKTPEVEDTAPAAETENAEPSSLSAILDGRDSHEPTPEHETEREVGPEPKPAAAPAAAAAAPAAQPAPAAETPTDPAAKPEREQPFWYRKEIEKERKARQAAEQRAAQLEQQQPRREPAEQDDPNRPLTWAEANAIRERDALIGRLERSEERFVDKHGETAFEETRDWLATRPDIEEWALKQRDPWRAAHSTYVKEKLAAEIGEDPNAWREAERERMRQELRAEMEAESQHTPARRDPPQMRSAPPAPASTARAAAPRERERGGTFAGPTPVSAILGKR
jgi:hypothetical protein